MKSNASLAARRSAAIPSGLAKHSDVYVDRAENAELWDVEGRRYIDFAAGIAVTNTGHRHPRVMERVRRQMERVTHTSFQTTPYEDYVSLCERLNALVPGDFAKKTFLVTTGAEAIENAAKIARAVTGRSALIAFSGAFHGRTLLAMSLTGKTVPYKAGFGPLVGDIYHAPFPIAFHSVSESDALDALQEIFRVQVDPSRVAAIFIEPVQGEGGFYPAPASFLKTLRSICDEHGILLVADEIQTGFARTGRMFAMEHSGVAADLVVMAKGLGGGFPIAAISGRADVMDRIPAGGVGSTFAGNPLACAAAHAVLDIIADEKLIERAHEIGRRIKARLEPWAQGNEFPSIGEVRGLGAMVALEFVTDRASRKPASDLAKAVTRIALDGGLLVLNCGVRANGVRLLPPLTIPFDLLEEGLDRLEAAIRTAQDI